MKRISVIVPHYHCLGWLQLCLGKLRSMSDDAGCFDIAVVDMSTNDLIIEDVYSSCKEHDARVIRFDAGGMVGGMPLPGALYKGVWDTFSQIKVLCDTDVVVLNRGWDTLIRETLTGGVKLCGINPRSETASFRNVVEWNFCAFDDEFWMKYISTFECRGHHDIGHALCDGVVKQGFEYATWPLLSNPISGKPAAICGSKNEHGETAVAFHAFYGTRRYHDPGCRNESAGMLSRVDIKKALSICDTY